MIQANETGPDDRPAEARSEPGPGSPDLSLGGKRVLVVEDEALVAMELQFALNEVGAVVVGPVGRLAEAMTAAEGEAIDAAILDIDLHGVDVFPAADTLARRGIPFLFHTGHGSRMGLGQQYPDVPVCPKPVSAANLLAELGRLVKPRF